MKLLLIKGNDRKRKCEEHETEIKKLEEALVTLYKKKKEVNNKQLYFSNLKWFDFLTLGYVLKVLLFKVFNHLTILIY